jgi:hypothetical protein
MSNYSQFFPTSSGGGGGETSTPGNRLNRRIFYGPLDSPTAATVNWTVPDTTNTVEVHAWGGGGGGFCALNPAENHCYGGGGGGGYARAEYDVTGGDILAITAGGITGTSSVTIPTQGPISPVSATAGSNTNTASGAAGGGGSVTLNPTFPTSYCMIAFGGSGGVGMCQSSPNPWPGTATFWKLYMGGGGGAAGSPLGPGCYGSCGSQPNWAGGGGGGIGGQANSGHGGGSRTCAKINVAGRGGTTNANRIYRGNSVCNRAYSSTRANCNEDVWWRVEDIQGEGGLGAGCQASIRQNNMIMAGGKGAGGGGAGVLWGCMGGNFSQYQLLGQGGRGGILGGGGGNILYCNDPGGTCITWDCCDGKGGAAGGSGGGQTGTPGIVIIYW